MNSRIKAVLYAVINIGGNLILLGVIPQAYKVYSLLVFNIVQVVYAYFDPSYVFQQLGKKFGRVYTTEDLK